MGADTKDLEAFRAKLEKLRDEEMAAFNERALKKLAAELLGLVIPATPVGKNTYETVNGKKRVTRNGGTLRRGWTAKTHEEAAKGSGSPGIAAITAHLNGVQITRRGAGFEIEIVNPVEYAIYVEYGHRTRAKQKAHSGSTNRSAKKFKRTASKCDDGTFKRRFWVEGQHMLEKSVQTLEPRAQATVQAELEKFLKEALDG